MKELVVIQGIAGSVDVSFNRRHYGVKNLTVLGICFQNNSFELLQFTRSRVYSVAFAKYSEKRIMRTGVRTTSHG